jgi:hypothetical protein
MNEENSTPESIKNMKNEGKNGIGCELGMMGLFRTFTGGKIYGGINQWSR